MKHLKILALLTFLFNLHPAFADTNSRDAIGMFLQEKMACNDKPVDWKVTFADTIFTGSSLASKADKYSSVLKSFDVRFTPPKGFTQIDLRGRDRILPMMTKDGIVDLRYFIGYESADNNVVILFPYLGTNSREIVDADRKYFIDRELRVNARDSKLDTSTMVKVISAPDMENYANADTAIVYYFDLFPNSELYLGSYNNCVGIYLEKKGYPALPLKILFTDKVKDCAIQFINDLLSCIRYGDNSKLEK